MDIGSQVRTWDTPLINNGHLSNRPPTSSARAYRSSSATSKSVRSSYREPSDPVSPQHRKQTAALVLLPIWSTRKVRGQHLFQPGSRINACGNRSQGKVPVGGEAVHRLGKSKIVPEPSSSVRGVFVRGWWKALSKPICRSTRATRRARRYHGTCRPVRASSQAGLIDIAFRRYRAHPLGGGGISGCRPPRKRHYRIRLGSAPLTIQMSDPIRHVLVLAGTGALGWGDEPVAGRPVAQLRSSTHGLGRRFVPLRLSISVGGR